jgi:hypothetical protein
VDIKKLLAQENAEDSETCCAASSLVLFEDSPANGSSAIIFELMSGS